MLRASLLLTCDSMPRLKPEAVLLEGGRFIH